MPNFSGVNFGKIRKAVKFPVEFPVESKSGRIHSKVSGTEIEKNNKKSKAQILHRIYTFV